jgi:hypothetical protein
MLQLDRRLKEAARPHLSFDGGPEEAAGKDGCGPWAAALRKC